MDRQIEQLIRNWQKRNIGGIFLANKQLAADRICEIIPLSASVGFSGSVTLDQLGIIKSLEERGNKVFNPYRPGITIEESLDLRRQGAQAEYYLASANGISEKGELVFFSGYGNRTSGISYARNVMVVCGINKIVPDLEAAVKRAREYATPLNCKRLGWSTPCIADGICHEDACTSADYKRMCCQILIIEAEVVPERLKVVLVGESLGF